MSESATPDPVTFYTGVPLEPGFLEAPLPIKSCVPELEYGFTFQDVYGSSPALDAYEAIRTELNWVDSLIADVLHLRARRDLPPAANGDETRTLLGAVFNPSLRGTNRVWTRLPEIRAGGAKGIVSTNSRPFPLGIALPMKLLHTFLWVDTNVKVQIEAALGAAAASAGVCQVVAECALKIYAQLLKCDDYELARSITFNYAMFLQDGVLNVILGDTAYLGEGSEVRHGRLANEIELRFLRERGRLSYRQLSALSVFMGVVWVSHPELQASYLARPGNALSRIEADLAANRRNWCVDHVDQMIADFNEFGTGTVAIILDDNGESVFDIALFQRLISDNPSLRSVFLINSFPVSTDISRDAFELVLEDEFFAELRKHFARDAATLAVESQPFRAFETQWLAESTRSIIDEARFLFIKRANYFKAFQIIETDRYYASTALDLTSMILTGGESGSGVLAKLGAGQEGYVYRSPDNVVRLVDIVGEQK